MRRDALNQGSELHEAIRDYNKHRRRFFRVVHGQTLSEDSEQESADPDLIDHMLRNGYRYVEDYDGGPEQSHPA